MCCACKLLCLCCLFSSSCWCQRCVHLHFSTRGATLPNTACRKVTANRNKILLCGVAAWRRITLCLLKQNGLFLLLHLQPLTKEAAPGWAHLLVPPQLFLDTDKIPLCLSFSRLISSLSLSWDDRSSNSLIIFMAPLLGLLHFVSLVLGSLGAGHFA